MKIVVGGANMSGFPEYANYDGVGLAELVRKGEVAPIDLVEESIRRIDALNPQLNAVVHKMYDQARATALSALPDAPFQGVPFLLKDLVAEYGGEPMRRGSHFFRDYVSPHDTEIVKRYKAAGLLCLGKSSTPELGITPITEPQAFGPTRNPWDLTRTAGGSSGGSAAAVAARLVPLASGGDGGGSIRIPAACCGLFGLKPSRGRTPTGPTASELWQGFAIEHGLTRSVRDSAALLDAIAGPDVGAPYIAPPPARPFLAEVGAPPGRLRIAFTAKPFLGSDVHQDCVQGLHATVKLLTELGHEVVEAAPPIEGLPFAKAFLTVVCADTAATIRDGEALVGRKASYQAFEATTWALYLLGQQMSAAELIQAKWYLQRAGRAISRFFVDYDLLLTPTLAAPPVVNGSLQPKGAEALAMKALGRLNAGPVLRAAKALESSAASVFAFAPYTQPFNVTGQPAMSVPLHWNEAGLPIGMHFVGRYGDEATLFRLAAQLEAAKPWRERVPSIIGREASH
jgi:amidase